MVTDGQVSSVQSLSCVRLCDPTDCSTPGFPVHHQLPELTQNSCPSSRGCHPTVSSSVVSSSHILVLLWWSFCNVFRCQIIIFAILENSFSIWFHINSFIIHEISTFENINCNDWKWNFSAMNISSSLRYFTLSVIQRFVLDQLVYYTR